MKRLIIIFLCVLSVQICHAQLFKKDSIHPFQSVGAGISHIVFDESLNGLGYSFNYRYVFNRWIGAGIEVSNASASNYPKVLDIDKLTSPEFIETKDYRASTSNSINLNLHLTILNSRKHFLSIYGGFGYFSLSSKAYFGRYSEVEVNGQVIQQGYFNFISDRQRGANTDYGILYQYNIGYDVLVGVNFRSIQPLKTSNTNELHYDNYNMYGLLVSKRF